MNEKNHTRLHLATLNEDTDEMVILLRAGVNVNAMDMLHRPLMVVTDFV